MRNSKWWHALLRSVWSQDEVVVEDDYEAMDITIVDSYFEESEINSSDDEESVGEPMSTNETHIFTRNSRVNQREGFIGSNTSYQDETQKKLDRAKRFSLSVQEVDSTEVLKEELSNLYKDLGIDTENEKYYRFNAIHMRGTENMSTEDVLQYFISYAPSHVEWINDVSCNVVWREDMSAARALLHLSKKLKNLEKVHLNADPFEKDFRSKHFEYVDHDEAVDAREIKAAIPPGYWRIGVPCKKSSSLLLRYATKSDKKQRNAEKNSEYYRKYGNPHFGNIPGLISNSLRSEVKKFKIKASGSNSVWEKFSEDGLEKKNPWEELAYEWGKMDRVEQNPASIRNSSKERRDSIPDLRISLKNKKERHKRLYSEISSSTSEKGIWENKSKIPRMKMYADDEEKRLEKNLGKKFQNNQFRGVIKEDLRSKINRKKSRTRFNFTIEKKPQISSLKESSNSENEYDDGDSGDWALEQYHDLRESLEHSKRQENVRYNRRKFESDNDDEDDENEDEDDDMCGRDLSRRSPLQIEIENDEYYLKRDH